MMIAGIGIDSVDIKRFQHWTSLSHKQLLRIFSENELSYAFNNPLKTAERLAVRFAAREALYKALSSSIITPIPFLLLCKSCQVKTKQPPLLSINWQKLEPFLKNITSLTSFLSLTHTPTSAIACVILQQIPQPKI